MHLCRSRCSDRQAHEAVCQLAGLIKLRAVGKDKTPFSPPGKAYTSRRTHRSEKRSLMENERPELPIPPEVRRRLDTWRTLWRVFLWLHYSLGVVGVLSSALAAALPVSWLVTLFAVLSACCFAVIGFVSPERRYLGLIRAWRTLDFAATQYKNGLLSLEELFGVAQAM
jgi:hypothetical protein